MKGLRAAESHSVDRAVQPRQKMNKANALTSIFNSFNLALSLKNKLLRTLAKKETKLFNFENIMQIFWIVKYFWKSKDFCKNNFFLKSFHNFCYFRLIFAKIEKCLSKKVFFKALVSSKYFKSKKIFKKFSKLTNVLCCGTGAAFMAFTSLKTKMQKCAFLLKSDSVCLMLGRIDA